jgi:MFS family permease
MYDVSDSTALLRAHRRLLSRAPATPRVARTVVLLGLTSLITDVSAEMVASVLPLYLIAIGGFSPLAFGLIDGIYQGATSLVGLASGFVGDRFRRHKDVAASGYGLSAVSKILLATAGTAVSAVGAIVLLDRIGKGIRTAPRDTMISLATPRDQLGTAFGVHRALDTTGAVLGPIVAFAMLAVAPLAFHSLFLVSFCIALVGVALLVLFVDPQRVAPDADADAGPATPSLRGAFGLLGDRRYRSLLVAGGALGLATASDAFIFLTLQERLDLGTSLFPLLFVGSSAIYMVLAVPMGRLADRVGRGRVFVGGYVLLLPVYASLLAPDLGYLGAGFALALVGASYAATDGVLAALASGTLDEEVRGSGLSVLTTATNLSRFVASVGFGALWTWAGLNTAVLVCGIALAAAIVATGVVLRSTREAAHGA